MGDEEEVDLADIAPPMLVQNLTDEDANYIKRKQVKRKDAPRKLDTQLYQPTLAPADVFHELGTVPAKADMTNLGSLWVIKLGF